MTRKPYPPLHVVVVLSAMLLPARSSAEVHLPKIFTDHMVLQQGMPVRVFGWAEPGEEVTVTFRGQSASTKAGDDKRWSVELPAMAADGKPDTLVVAGKNRIELKDVLLGEVWLASGQSNMNRPVGGKAIQEAQHPNLRLFTTNGTIPRKDTLNDTIGWVPCTPESIATCGDMVSNRRRAFSEVAYHFALEIHQRLEVPVGIIHTSMGGTTAKDWTPNPRIAEEYPFDQDPGDVRHKRGIVYQARLHALIPYTIKGVVWYQGEDDGRNKDYAQDLTAMIGAWRKAWGRELPFYMAQIAQTTYASGMLKVWEAQAWVMQNVPRTGLAPSNDLNDGGDKSKLRAEQNTGWPIGGNSNPHPPNKHIIAGRLARMALAEVYGQKLGEVYGPMLDSYEVAGQAIRVKFKHAGEGLTTDDDQAPNWFEVAGEDGKYVKATARIAGMDCVEVSSPEVASPRSVRFAWHALARHNLYNKAGLPALPFQTKGEER